MVDGLPAGMQKLKQAWDEIMSEELESRDSKGVTKKPKVMQLFGNKELIISEQISKIN